MDFIDEMRHFSTHVTKVKDAISTEEATKNALVLPFFKMLGYDIFNPLEFVPEYAADFGVKKDARVDYAIMNEGKPIILIECKSCSESVVKHSGQLFQYFAATPAKFGILTNGITYNFYTDLNESNKMDFEPFLTFDILDIDENVVPELRRFAKSTLDLDAAKSAASELKHMGKIKELLSSLRAEPSDGFVRYVMGEIYDGRATQKAVDEFRPIIKRGFIQYINDAISDTLKSAIRGQSEMSGSTSEPPAAPENEDEDMGEDNSIITLEEIEAFAIAKSILRDMMDVDRLTYQHTKDYMVILFDGNSRKRVCRFWFGRKQKYITTPDESMKPRRHDISSLNDIYKYAEQIREVCDRYI
ncbi:MAG: type I restriction endonuclease [Oscillospiraceae bacterium]|nr:type I restriction endonuclease [Oscillospiraceae bacterium]